MINYPILRQHIDKNDLNGLIVQFLDFHRGKVIDAGVSAFNVGDIHDHWTDPYGKWWMHPRINLANTYITI